MTVTDTIKAILVDDLGVERPKAEICGSMPLRDELNIDSLSFEELRVRMEEVFHITISEQEFAADRCPDLDSVVALVESLLARSAHARENSG
ncbi:acyl carrier protein [Streptomyces sp. NPDC047097]|uniref:acyl carrier protein n=1 Tax=Streptomyces sp. NPDC047097 TaxID=3155260 RepID=UPI0033CB1725